MSKVLNETERNYEIYNKEMLAIMTAPREWRQYLMGASEDARWMMKLVEYHFMLWHKPGETHVNPDILLRRDLKRREKDNENLTLLKEEHFRQNIFQQVFTFNSIDNDFLTCIRGLAGKRD